MRLKYMFITNDINTALIAEKHGVERIWVDLETIGKDQRQKNMDSVKSQHCFEDIDKLHNVLTKSKILVRINPFYEGTLNEVNESIRRGADIIMLPMFRTSQEVQDFLEIVDKRVKTCLLLETAEAVQCIDKILEIRDIEEIHIGLNDLHLSYNLKFLFEPLANGLIQYLAEKIKKCNIPFGFGGVATLGTGLLPAERILEEHFRLGSSQVILSRAFCDTRKVNDYQEIEHIFFKELGKLREYESFLSNQSQEFFDVKHSLLCENVKKIIQDMGAKA